jgi:predicted DCC family thiol-disulfide oxidoreductase YuxK
VDLVPYQTEGLETRWPMISQAECAREIHVIDRHGRVTRGARGIAEVLRSLSFGWRLLGTVIAHPPALWLARVVYRWVARNRHRLGSKACTIDRPASGG